MQAEAFRHYYASRLIFGGASVYEVKEYLGHSSIEITDRYYGQDPFLGEGTRRSPVGSSVSVK